MHLCEYDSDPIRPDTCELLSDLGVNVDCVRDALVDDQARACPFPTLAGRELEKARKGESAGAGERDRPGFPLRKTSSTETITGAPSWLLD